MYYGDENDKMVVRTKHRKGTNKAYRFATVNVLIEGERFTLIAVPVGPFASKEKILGDLLDYASKIVNIGTVHLDRGFFTVNCIQMLEDPGVKFLMPATKGKRVKEEMEKGAPRIVDFEYGVNREDPVKLNLAVVGDEDGGIVIFATNLGVEEGEESRLLDLYLSRWGIETSYRVKASLRPKTASKNYGVRLFYFLFSVCLYLWILVNFLAGTETGEDFEKIRVTAKLFCTAMSLPPPKE